MEKWGARSLGSWLNQEGWPGVKPGPEVIQGCELWSTLRRTMWVQFPWTSTTENKLFPGLWEAESLLQTVQVPGNDLWGYINPRNRFQSPHQGSTHMEGAARCRWVPEGLVSAHSSVGSLGLSENVGEILTGASKRAREAQLGPVLACRWVPTAQTLGTAGTRMPHLSRFYSFHFRVVWGTSSVLSVHALDETNLSGFIFNQ